MTTNVFLTSDTHFGHSNILTFDPPRPFATVEEMDETLIANWNSVVKPQDKVYHLGDVTFKFAYLQAIMPRLNGTKVLIKGNHDNFKLSQYAQYFKDVCAYSQVDKFFLSHIPIHEFSVGRWKGNIHGHTHFNKIPDERYINVCVEQTNYTPISLDEILCTH